MPNIYWLSTEDGERYVLKVEGTALDFGEWQALQDVAFCKYFHMGVRLHPGIQALMQTTFDPRPWTDESEIRPVGLWVTGGEHVDSVLEAARVLFIDRNIIGVVTAQR